MNYNIRPGPKKDELCSDYKYMHKRETLQLT